MCLTTTGAYVYCPVPLSTYIYVDPMKAIKRDNQVRQRSGLPPVWLPAERQKRIKLARHGLSLGLGPGSVSASGSGQSLGEPFDLARELAMETAALSIFAFAMNGHLVKLRSGCLVGSYEGDEEAYEEFALAHIRDRRDITVVKVGTPVDFSLAR
ncbi:unnamed protein product [Protopolystoma xenopodis]|uniref:Uncharacterized protein n=1 Tax=Protopolystoma xenopodis TaxID=117903 RepID=A0A448X912_9PLAT|nr:unnamed protein product [Protopolystoma xenopodis]